MDDFGFYANENYTEGFVSSNRPGGKGKDDIYSWTSSEMIDFFASSEVSRTLCFIEKGSNKKIPEVNIELSNSNNSSFGMQFNSDIKGSFTYSMVKKNIYHFNISKESYKSNQISIDPGNPAFLENECLLVELEKLKRPTAKATFFNAKTKKTLSNALVKINSPCFNEPKRMKANNKGALELVLECNCQYTIQSMDSAFEAETKSFSTNQNCYGQKNLNFRFDLKEKKKEVYNNLIGTKSIKKGMVIELKNIYYDYNKSNIKKEATIDLNNLVDLMNTYPSLEIELGSHTDSRGTDAYNMELSTKRAAAARQYIISKGIAANRISSKGYGETQLLNQCKNGINCDDSEHQLNRRTEVIVTKLDDRQIQFKTKN